MPDEVTPGQTSISDDKVGDGEVADDWCDWCQSPATKSYPIVRKVKGGKPGAVLPTGMFVYACDEHKETAERAVAEPRKAL